MNGDKYSTYEEFMSACRKLDESLDPGHSLAKIYSIHQIKELLSRLDIQVASSDIEATSGIKRRYSLAYEIAEKLGAEEVGNRLRDFDHELFFPLLSFSALPNSKPYDSIDNFITLLNSKNISIDEEYNLFVNNNGFMNPKGRHCYLESVYYSKADESVSFLYSCNRILVKPDEAQGDFNNWFFARIPVILRLLFKQKIAEFSLPRFSEATTIEGWSNKEPYRYQLIIDSAKKQFLELVGYNFDSIDHDSLTLYFESILKAEDLGWTIAPLVGAEFDLEQNVIPLKEIFDQFSKSLKMEILNLRIEHVLSEVDLYKVFRALKEQSYTSSLVLNVPLGSRGGGVRLSVLYGGRNSAYFPLVVIGKNRADIAKSLRDTVEKSQTKKLESPYNLKTLLTT